MVYVDFIKQIKSLVSKYLGAKLGKELSPWIWNQAGRGVENTPDKIASFQNILRSNLDLIVTKAEVHNSQKKYLSFLVELGRICYKHSEIYLASDLYDKVIIIAKKSSTYEKQLGQAVLGKAIIFADQAKFKDSAYLVKLANNYFSAVADVEGQVECINILGIIEGEKGNLSKAQRNFENALAKLRGTRKRLLKASIMSNLGILNNIRGDYTRALKYFEQAGKIYKELKMNGRYANVKHNIGMLEMKKGRYDAALKQFAGCINVAESEQYHPVLGITHAGISEAYIRLGNMKMANEHLEKARSISYRSNDRLTLADLYRVQGLIERKKKKYDLAELFFKTSTRINTELENKLNVAEAREELGKMLIEVKRDKKARSHLDDALNYYRQIGFESKIHEINKLIKK